MIATLEDLDEDALVTILTEPKNALTKQYQKLFELEDVQLTFTDDALQAIAKKAIERKTGARGLRSIIENLLLNTMFEVPDIADATEVIVSDKTVDEGEEPKIVKSKSKKKASKSKKVAKTTDSEDDAA